MAERAGFQVIEDKEQWDSEVLALPHPHFLQSATWAGFKGHTGWEARLLRLLDGYSIVGYCAVLSRSGGLGGLRVAYAPRGPLLVSQDQKHLEAALAALELLAKQEKWILIKVDPDVWGGQATAWAKAMAKRQGWNPGDQVQFRNTVTLDITAPDEESLLSAMKPKTRYNVKLSGRRGVSVRPVAGSELETVYALYEETAARDGFIIRPMDYYLSLWSALLEARMGVVLLAEHDHGPLAAAVIVAYGSTAWYFHGASSTENRNLMATYLLQWEAIRWARARGCSTYDMWGAPESADENDPMAGLLRFKLGFGGLFRQGLGAWDYSARPQLYSLYRQAMPRLVAIRRLLHRSRR